MKSILKTTLYIDTNNTFDAANGLIFGTSGSADSQQKIYGSDQYQRGQSFEVDPKGFNIILEREQRMKRRTFLKQAGRKLAAELFLNA